MHFKFHFSNCNCYDDYTLYPIITTPAPGIVLSYATLVYPVTQPQIKFRLFFTFMKWILVCEVDESILGDGNCDAEAADYECLYDGGDCDGTVSEILKKQSVFL